MRRCWGNGEITKVTKGLVAMPTEAHVVPELMMQLDVSHRQFRPSS